MQRRRFIKILAGSTAALSLGKVRAASSIDPVYWRGYALGAEGCVTLYTDHASKAQSVLQQCLTEIVRLEKCFSLYDNESELCQLNRIGYLAHPSADWYGLLDAVELTHKQTNGLFDPTIQPLWQLYADHFAAHPSRTDGPSAQSIRNTLTHTGWKHVEWKRSHICLKQQNMRLSLNGIAQGYITDRISQLLQDNGFQHVLVELGETRAIGCHPTLRPWQIGIKNAKDTTQLRDIAELDNQALATSGSYDSTFSADGSYHHLIHPQTGLPATRWSSLSVIAPTATQADALSTGLSFATATQIDQLLAQNRKIRILKQA